MIKAALIVVSALAAYLLYLRYKPVVAGKLRGKRRA